VADLAPIEQGRQWVEALPSGIGGSPRPLPRARSGCCAVPVGDAAPWRRAPQNRPHSRVHGPKARPKGRGRFKEDPTVSVELPLIIPPLTSSCGSPDSPCQTEFIVEGVIQNRLRYRSQRHVQIGDKTIASIVPIAQSEVVRGFIDGMDPGMEELLNSFLDQVFSNYPSTLLNHVPGLTGPAKATATKKTQAASKEILREFRESFGEFRRQTLVDPIVSTAALLPKDELAAMAESLVSLTSFKRKFSPDAETVGGPIDVAVLSKGDGFVWIKRKHYFKPELNPHFLTNYFEGE